MSIITVGISDLAVSKNPDIIVTYALGSCVGICLYDKTNQIGGMAHIMLPSSIEVSLNENGKKFADTGIYLLLKELERAGAKTSMLQAKIAGGAQMFTGINTFNIGLRNIKAVKQVLEAYRIPIIAEETGDKIGRTIFYDLKSGALEVKSAIHGSKIL